MEEHCPAEGTACIMELNGGDADDNRREDLKGTEEE